MAKRREGVGIEQEIPVAGRAGAVQAMDGLGEKAIRLLGGSPADSASYLHAEYFALFPQQAMAQARIKHIQALLPPHWEVDLEYIGVVKRFEISIWSRCNWDCGHLLVSVGPALMTLKARPELQRLLLDGLHAMATGIGISFWYDFSWGSVLDWFEQQEDEYEHIKGEEERLAQIRKLLKLYKTGDAGKMAARLMAKKKPSPVRSLRQRAARLDSEHPLRRAVETCCDILAKDMRIDDFNMSPPDAEDHEMDPVYLSQALGFSWGDYGEDYTDAYIQWLDIYYREAGAEIPLVEVIITESTETVDFKHAFRRALFPRALQDSMDQIYAYLKALHSDQLVDNTRLTDTTTPIL